MSTYLTHVNFQHLEGKDVLMVSRMQHISTLLFLILGILLLATILLLISLHINPMHILTLNFNMLPDIMTPKH